jgi:chloramphenicol-sensitive protein RarD
VNPGVLYAALAFVAWGLFPLYFHLLAAVAPMEVVLHRAVWCLVFLAGVLAVRRQWAWLATALRQPRVLLWTGASALVLAVNWLLYIVALQNGRVVEASLGYFINPLVNVLLGVLVLRERLAPVQRAAVALAACGVAWLTWQAGQLPWYALSLAFTFALYGLLRKTSPLGPLEGLALETLLVAPLALPWLAWWTVSAGGVLLRGDAALIFWVLLAGPLTALPLMLFAAAARRLRLATVGLMQYISPTLQLACGVFFFREPFDADKLVGFAFIWAALAVYTAHALRTARAPAAPGG